MENLGERRGVGSGRFVVTERMTSRRKRGAKNVGQKSFVPKKKRCPTVEYSTKSRWHEKKVIPTQEGLARKTKETILGKRKRIRAPNTQSG